MEDKLSIVNGSEIFTLDEQKQLDSRISSILRAHTMTQHEINSLAFECTAYLTEADEAATKLENKGWFRSVIGSITGSNKKLQDKINENVIAAQYISQVILQKLAEQNLLTLDLIATINNKLNVLSIRINERFKQQSFMLAKFFIRNRRSIIDLETRLSIAERNVSLLNWKNTIEYQTFSGIEYSMLDTPRKMICVARDFFDLTNGNWNTTDLLLLKGTIKNLGIKPKQQVNYFQGIQTLAYDSEIRNKFLGENSLQEINPEYFISLGALNKLLSLEGKERYLVDEKIDNMKEIGLDIDRYQMEEQLTNDYMREKANVDLNCNVEAYDFTLDLVYNLNEAISNNMLVPINQ